MEYVVCANGLYDVACAICIVWYPQHMLGRIHVDVFVEPVDGLSLRLLAFWLITYGVVRSAAILRNKTINQLVACTYLLEGMFFALELFLYNTTHVASGLFIVASSTLFATASMRLS
jgi:hypothetical protein